MNIVNWSLTRIMVLLKTLSPWCAILSQRHSGWCLNGSAERPFWMSNSCQGLRMSVFDLKQANRIQQGATALRNELCFENKTNILTHIWEHINLGCVCFEEFLTTKKNVNTFTVDVFVDAWCIIQRGKWIARILYPYPAWADMNPISWFICNLFTQSLRYSRGTYVN